MRTRTLLLAAVTALIAVSCGDNHFLTDKTYRQSVQQDFNARAQAHDGALAPFMALPDSLTQEETEALQFLYAYMPLADLTDYPAGYYLENVRLAFNARGLWDVPEREFRHFVLPVRVNNENLDSHRSVFQQELLPRIQGLGMQDAILEVNHWCHEKVTYQPSDARTSSPLNTVKNALGRCGEQSTFTVAALRSVGIPARQVYTPRWAHTDDNHAWVEAWADGRWWFLGACEPEPVLNLGWFNAPASRAMLMHTKAFGRYDGPEEVVLVSPNYTEINLIDNYARTARVDFRVLRADGTPAPGARLDFCIYNYAEFYPAVTKYADAEGRSFIKAGLGDLLVWASQDGAFGYARASFGKDERITIILEHTAGNTPGAASFLMVPPPEDVTLPPVTPEQRAANDRRFAQEDSLRHAYEATFPTPAQAMTFLREQGYGPELAPYILRARGNAGTLMDFLSANGNFQRREQILQSLSTKDLHDITPELLQAYYLATPFYGTRVENEFLTDYYGFFQDGDGAQATLEGITVLDDPTLWRIPMSPEGVWRSRLADPRSMDIYTVCLLRARGRDARKNPVTGVLEVREGDGPWTSLDTAPGQADPKGTLRLTYRPSRAIDNPKYYSHFTLSKLVDGRPSLLSFDEGEVDMGGGVDWAHVFRKGAPLDTGTYLLVSGNRCADGSVPVTLLFFTVEEGRETVVELKIEENLDAVPVIGSFDAESRIQVDGQEVSVLSQTGRGFYVLALLDTGKEPTNHVLRDLAAAREQLENWGRPIVLLCSSQEALERLRKEEREGRYGKLPVTVVFGVAPEGLLSGARPVVLVADSFNRVFFRSEGYTIGLGERLAALLARL